jgi:CHAD domain-containing protein
LDFCQELAACHENPQDLLATNVFQATTDAFAEVVRLRQAIDSANSETIHSTRVAFKKFRYLVEALSPDFTGLGKSQLRRFGNYQRRMGDLQDLEMLQACVARFIQEHPETAATLRPFCCYLRSRRARTLRSALKHADDVFDLWYPARLDQHGDAVLTRAA